MRPSSDRRLAASRSRPRPWRRPSLGRRRAFYLKDGDRVVFYGDSITDQRLYTTFVETYVVTRFPKLNVTFVHSGWGGDRVTGGGGGPIDVRLKRDVFAYKPTVVTIMLGMNDASYQAFDPKIFDTYAKGYEHIVESVKDDAPGRPDDPDPALAVRRRDPQAELRGGLQRRAASATATSSRSWPRRTASTSPT